MRMFFALFLFASTLFSYEIEQIKEHPRIYMIHDFMTAHECEHMIESARPLLKPSTVVDESKPHGWKLDPRRSSHGMFFPQYPQDPVLRGVEQRIAEITGFPVENGEAIQVLWYQVNGEYQPHYDYFNANTPGGATSIARGGQRVATVIMYLNDPEAGGETIFPRVKVSVQPKKGSAVLFYSCDPSGKEDPLSMHGGAAVQAGEKWIATKWIRMGAFR